MKFLDKGGFYAYNYAVLLIENSSQLQTLMKSNERNFVKLIENNSQQKTDKR